MPEPHDFEFTAVVWPYSGAAGSWHFVTLPAELADELAEGPGEHRPGFGSLRVRVTIGATTWETSIFPDKRAGSYVLPLKAAVRRSERIEVGDEVVVRLSLGAR